MNTTQMRISEWNASETNESFSGANDGDEVEQHPHYLDVPPTHTIVIVSSIMLVGFILNATILRCYWRSTTSTSVYIRVLAVYDICVLVALGVGKSLLVFDSLHHEVSEKIAQAICTSLGNFYLVGPLFLAMDRVLVVAFPLEYRQHERTVRLVKFCIIGSILVVITLAHIFITGLQHHNIFTTLISAVMTGHLFLQFLACIVLYSIIIVKIKMQEQSMAQHRCKRARLQ